MASTDWFRNAIIYHLLIDRFAGVTREDRLQPEFLGGNLRALGEKLPYLRELGINTLWISPFCKTSAYHGYSVTDYWTVEPRFGTLEDLKALIACTHRAGMRIIADFVPNHCSDRHPFFQEARADRRSRYFDWFLFKKWPKDYLCFLDVRELPKLNLDHPEARDHVVGAARYWLSLGLDGFRLDHVLGPRHAFWKQFRREMKEAYPAAVLIGEAWLEGVTWRHLETLGIDRRYRRWLFGVSQDEIQREYCGELDGVLDFRFRSMACAQIAHGRGSTADGKLEGLLRQRLTAYPGDCLLPTFLDNHDTSRFLYECRNDREKLKRAARLQFSLDQPPVIYYGTEAGMTHDRPVGVGPHSDLQARQPMIWNRPDDDLLAFYRGLIRTRAAKTGEWPVRPSPRP